MIVKKVIKLKLLLLRSGFDCSNKIVEYYTIFNYKKNLCVHIGDNNFKMKNIVCLIDMKLFSQPLM